MSTIFEPLSESITNQIKIRQDIMANKVTNPTVRNAYLNRACKVKLVPLVKDTKGDTDYNDFVFGNFTLEDNFFNNPDFKFSDKAEKPYINNFEVVTRSGDNYGATRTGKISIVIPTKKQFNLIERYFRIGVPFLLEWGWAEHVKYEGNNPTKETTEFIDPTLYEGDKINGTELEEAVFNNKEKQNGNYDGGLFFITNFTTNIQNNGVDYYYVLDINMVTKGDILNNLKQNKTTDLNTSTSADIENRIDSEPLIRFLKILEQDGVEKITDLLLEEAFVELREEQDTIFDLFQQSSQEIRNDLTSNFIGFVFEETIRKKRNRNLAPYAATGAAPVEAVFDSYTVRSSYSYIKLKYILELLSKFDIKGDLKYIDNNYEYKLPLYYYNLPSNLEYYKWFWDPEKHFASIDPTKFILPHYNNNEWKNDFVKENIIPEKDKFKIGNILIRIEFLINEISNLIRKDEYSINNILALILNTINRYTDNDIRLIKYDINDFEYSIVSIVDGDDLNTDNLPTLKLYGTGSIVEETNIDTVINDNISSQVAIMMNGSSDYVTDSQAISLLKFNNGIKSRIKTDLPEKPGLENLDSILKTISSELISYHSVLTEGPESDYITSGPQFDILKLYRRFKQEYIAAIIEYNQYDNIKGTPLFPIKIKTRLPGISGIPIGSKLKIEDVRLPDIYIDRNVYYLVTNYNSTVNNRYWESHIDLSPQINTQLTQIGQSDYESKQGLIATADIEKVLDAIKVAETGKYYFRENNGPEWIRGSEPRIAESDNLNFAISNEVLYIRRPLYADGLFIDEKTARRGPFQLTPLQYFEVQTADNDVIEYDFNSGVAGSPDARYLWSNPDKFSRSIDTIVGSREIARAYIEKLSKDIPSEQRTYLRLLSIHYWGRKAINLEDLKSVEAFKDNNYLTFLRDSRRTLYNILGVELTELNDDDLKKIGVSV